MRWLQELEAEVDHASLYGRTALMIAAEAGHLEAVRLLVAHGADADFADLHGETPLMVAAKGGRDDVVEYLVEGYAWLR